jgi:hypothetical protein
VDLTKEGTTPNKIGKIQVQFVNFLTFHLNKQNYKAVEYFEESLLDHFSKNQLLFQYSLDFLQGIFRRGQSRTYSHSSCNTYIHRR